MKRIYVVRVYFDYPDRFYGERCHRSYLVAAGSLATAVQLGQRLANRDRNGGYAPRIERVEEQGVLHAK